MNSVDFSRIPGDWALYNLYEDTKGTMGGFICILKDRRTDKLARGAGRTATQAFEVALTSIKYMTKGRI